MQKKKNVFKTNKKSSFLLYKEPLDAIGIILTIIAIFILNNLSIVFLDDEQFPNVSKDSIDLFGKGVLGFSIILIVKIIYIVKSTQKEKLNDIISMNFDPKTSPYDIIYATMFYLSIQIFGALLRGIKIFQVTAIQVLAFYFSSSIMEEVLYRGALVMGLQFLLIELLQIKNENQQYTITLIIILFSGIVFSFIHFRYWNEPVALIVTFLGGVSQAFWYVKTKSLYVVMLSHGIVNMIASGSIIQSLGL